MDDTGVPFEGVSFRTQFFQTAASESYWPRIGGVDLAVALCRRDNGTDLAPAPRRTGSIAQSAGSSFAQ